MSANVNSLPSIPSLPPLQISTVESPDSLSRESLQTSRTSLSSRQSFITAITASQQGTPVTTDTTELRATSPSLATPLGLRKSISADSFVQYGREPVQKSAPRSNRGHTSPGSPSSPVQLADATARLRQENEIIQRSKRLRNSVADAAQLVIGDSDVERSDPLLLLGDRTKRTSSRATDRYKVPVRGGELPLPSRTPTISMVSTTSSVSGVTPNARDHPSHGLQRLQSASSMQSMSRRSIINSAVSNPTGRARSGSLGVYVTQSGKPILVNTRLSVRETLSSNSEITLAVVGSTGCGKTTVIRKGLKSYSLSEATTFSVQSASVEMHGPPRYTRRIGRVTENEGTPESALHVFEVQAPLPHWDPNARQVLWPDGAPRLDGVIICYDASDFPSFSPVESLIQGYRALKLPTVVLACKSDLETEVEPQRALDILQKYDVGLVEVANSAEGKEKMRRSFDWLLKAIYRERRSNRTDADSQYRNPASPDVLMSPPLWESPPTSVSSVAPLNTAAHIDFGSPRQRTSSSYVQSPTRTRSMGDLLTGHDHSKSRDWQPDKDTNEASPQANASTSSLTKMNNSAGEVINSGHDEIREEPNDSKEKEKPTQWSTLEELLDKLVFLAVSGDDPAYISHFLLTYRRFANPRSVLLAMQKRMRQLDNPSGDPMFACFAQMRICGLLETWIHDYPHDFAVRGTSGALSALIKSIIGKTYLLHYGSDFLPFLEVLPNLADTDSAWSIKPDDIADESDDTYSLGDDDEDITPISENGPSDTDSASPTSLKGLTGLLGYTPPSKWSLSAHPDGSELSVKQLCRDLVKIAHEVNALDPEEIAQEITRIGVKMFLDIEPRHWLRFTFVSGKKDPQTCTIAGYNEVSSHLAEWVVSLILCHDRPKARAKQMEKLAEVAQKLRALNNYSALRAFVAGINNSTFPGDDTMEIFKSKSPEQAKNLQSWDLLLQHIRSHRAYRMALRNSKGACIPALEVHISDMIRAHEGNADYTADMAGKVHWGKYNMIGRFISATTRCQAQCRGSTEYNFPERPHISNLIFTATLMNEDMQKSRIAPPTDMDMIEDPYRPHPRVSTREIHPARDPLLRKFMFWS